nr:F-box protein PP2-B15-like [Ipomoea batatas]GMD42249.1 F-box protein PP2-B15-like [Ipomoea batatas]
MAMASNEASLDLLPEDCVVQILSHVPPRLACRSSLLSATIRAAAESELLWETFLPSDYRDIICRLVSPIMFESKKELFVKLLSPLLIDGGHKTFCIDRESSKKCFTLSARDLSIAFSRNALYWCWKPLLGSRFPEIVELIMVSWLEIKGNINTRILSPNTTYGAYFIFKLAGRAFGLDAIPSEISIKVGSYQSDRIIYLRQNSYNKQAMERLFMLNRVETLRSRLHEQQECTIHERDDGWLEIELGEFYNDGSEKEVQMSFREVKGEHLKGGLIVEGIELRPK